MKLINALFWSLTLVFYSALLSASATQQVEACKVPPKVTFSSIEHPKVQNFIQPLIADVYGKVGIKTEFLIVSSYRDLMLVANKQLMGSVVFAEDIIDIIPELIKVNPPISKMSYVLLCSKEARCDSAVLTADNSDAKIVTTNAMAKSLSRRYPGLNQQRLLPTSEMKNVMSFIRKERVSYGVYPISDRTKGGLGELPPDLNHAILYDIDSYHVLNKDYACLLPLIEPVLESALLAM